MKTLRLSFILLSNLPAYADTYTGVVFGIKHFSGGAVAVDLDKKYPDQKITFYISVADAATVGALSAQEDKVTATWDVIQYHGKPEIKVTKKDQRKF